MDPEAGNKVGRGNWFQLAALSTLANWSSLIWASQYSALCVLLASGFSRIVHYYFDYVGIPVNFIICLQVYSGAGTLLGAFLNMFTVKYIGKRQLLIFSILISTACQFTLGVFGLGHLKSITNNAWLPFGLFCCISFISGYGITPIPWILLGEIFPMK